MSLHLSVYAVRLKDVFSVFGNGDASLVDRIRETSPARYRIRNWSYSSTGLEEGGPTVDETIRDLVSRRIGRPDCSWRYCYALELICEYLGTELDSSEFAGLHAGIDEVLDYAGIRGLAAMLMRLPRYPIPIPLDIEHDPVIACLTTEEAAAALTEMARSTNDRDLEGSPTEQEKMYRQFRSWLEYSVHTQTDLVCFYY